MPAAGSTDTMDSGDHMWTFAVSRLLAPRGPPAAGRSETSTSARRCHAVPAEPRRCWSLCARLPTAPPRDADASPLVLRSPSTPSRASPSAPAR